MFAYPLRAAALAAAFGLSACMTPYGSSGVSVGLGNSSYYDPYYGDGYGYPQYGYGYGAGYPGYGSGYGFNPYWGWNDGFYYPGTGFYVYDRYRRPFRWTDTQRRYWTVRREQALATTTNSRPIVIRDNWDDFTRDRASVRRNRAERQLNRPVRAERAERPVAVQQSVTRADKSAAREQRQAAREQRQAVREQRQAAREQRRSEIRAEQASRGNGRNRSVAREE